MFLTLLALLSTISQGLLPLLLPIARAQTATPMVVINELFWMGSSGSTADEWVELRNLTDQPVDLSGWQLTKLSGGAEVLMLTLPVGKSILANGYFVISNYAETAANSVLAITPDVINTDMALSNSALQISLYNGAHEFIDRADDGAGNPLAGRYVSSEKTYASMERNTVPGNGTVVEAWHTASRGVGFKPEKTEQGTPGSGNSNGQPVVQAGDDRTGTVGVEINFDGSDSFDPENQPMTFAWDFGDSQSSSEATPKHSYAAAGEYTLRLTVSDGVDTATDTAKVTITLAPAAAPIKSSPTPPVSSTRPTTSCVGVSIAELFPNPIGVDEGEFIELYNPTAVAVPLDGCIVWVNDKRRFTIPANTGIAAKAWWTLEKSVSSLSLTNTGGTVLLKDTDGTMIDSVTYPPSVENETWAKLGQAWGWTNQPTPGATNKETKEVPEEEKTKPSSKSSTKSVKKAEAPAVAVTIADVQNVDSGDRVRVLGIVTVPTDVHAARTITVQDDSGAMTVLLAEAAVQPKLGDQVELIGLVRSYQGRKRISVKVDGIKILKPGQIRPAKKVPLDQVDVELADQLVEVTGLISSASGAKIVIDDGTGEAVVYLKSSTGIVKPTMQSGDRLVVTGIVNVTTAGIRLLPRTLDDLRVERVLGAATAKPAVAKSLPAAPTDQSLWYWALVAGGLAAAGVKPLLDYLKKKRTEKVPAVSAS